MQIAWCKLCHIDERHPTGIETEQEHIPCKLQTGVQTQVQLFQLLDDFQGECPLDGLVDAGIYMAWNGEEEMTSPSSTA